MQPGALFGEFDLHFAQKTIFSLRYKPDQLQSGSIYAGIWNSQQWQVHRFSKILSESFAVLCEGKTVLTTSTHNWQLAPRQIDVTTTQRTIRFLQHPWSQSIDDENNHHIISASINWSLFTAERGLTVSQHADPETVLPLLIYSLYAGFISEGV